MEKIPEVPEDHSESTVPFLETSIDKPTTSALPKEPLLPDLEIVIEPLIVRRKSSAATAFGSSVLRKDFGSNNNNNDENVTESEPKVKQGWRRYLGIIYTILAVNMLSLFTTISKKFSHIHPFNMSIWSSPAAILLTALAILYSLKYQKGSVSAGVVPFAKNKKNWLLLWVRSVTSTFIGYATIMAFQYVTAADVRTVVSASVIMVYIFSWMCLGEKCGVVPTLVALVALVGIGIMTRPPALTGAKEFESGTLIGIALSFFCMFLVAINLVIIRYLQVIHHGVMNTVGYIWSFFQAIILSLSFGVFEWPTRNEVLGLSFSGCCLALALAFLVLALQIEEAGVVALVRTSEVFFVFLWQLLIVGTYPDIYSIIGALLVVLGVVVVTLRKWIGSLPSDDRKRKNLAFLLL